MPRLSYVGTAPQDPADVASRLQAQTALVTGPINRTQASSAVHDYATATMATKTYIDAADATYAAASYFTGRDALNAPNSSRGAPNGAATLDAGTKVPLAQIPNMGAGYLKGPFGPTAVFTTGAVTTTPVRIADFNLGVQSLAFRMMCFASIYASATGSGQPIIEARIADVTSAPSYGSSTLIARGAGRTLFNDVQAVAVMPASDEAVSDGAGLAPSYRIWVSLWLYEGLGQGSVAVGSGAIASAGCYLLRTAA